MEIAVLEKRGEWEPIDWTLYINQDRIEYLERKLLGLDWENKTYNEMV